MALALSPDRDSGRQQLHDLALRLAPVLALDVAEPVAELAEQHRGVGHVRLERAGELFPRPQPVEHLPEPGRLLGDVLERALGLFQADAVAAEQRHDPVALLLLLRYLLSQRALLGLEPGRRGARLGI